MKRNRFIERSLLGALSFLKNSVFAEEYALKKGLLQSFNPGIKIIAFLLLLVTALLIRKIEVLISLYVACLALALLSCINLGFFLKRTWVFIPVFSFFIAIPALFSIFSPGEALFGINIFGLQLTVTYQGMSSASLFVLRVLVGVSYAVLLSLTTRHTLILRTLRIFGIPQIFVMTLGMSYRYIYLFLEIIENTYLSIKSRTGGAIRYRRGQKIIAWNIAYLWQRSYNLSQDVYSAMLSRGYTGEAKSYDSFRVNARDMAGLIFILMFCGLVLFINFWN